MNKKLSELNLMFPSPVWTSIISNHKDVNNKMLKYIKSLQVQNLQGITKSNLVGWHSENFDLENNEPRFFINSISSNLIFPRFCSHLASSSVKYTSKPCATATF